MDEHGSTYRDDFYGWTREQAEVLRGMRGLPNLPNDLDLENVIEEIDEVGNSVRSAVESYIRLILVHLVKAAAATAEEPRAHWRGEVAGFQADLIVRYSPSMRRTIDLDRTWSSAIRQARVSLEEHGETLPRHVAPGCPLPFDLFLDENFPFEEALELVRRALEADSATADRA